MPLDQVNDFHALILQCRDEQSLRPRIKGERVEPPFDTLERDGTDGDQRHRRSSGLGGKAKAGQYQQAGLCCKPRGHGCSGSFRVRFVHIRFDWNGQPPSCHEEKAKVGLKAGNESLNGETIRLAEFHGVRKFLSSHVVRR